MNWLQKRKSESQLKKAVQDNVEVFKIIPSEFDLKEYQLVDKSLVSDALGLAPSVILGISNIASTNKISNVLENGVFRVKFKDGFTGVSKLCKNAEGNYITTYLDENKKFNQAGLVDTTDKISNPLKNMNAAATVAIVMQAVSVVVGEYYKCEINNNLVQMKYELKSIASFMNNLQLAEIISSFDYLQKILRDQSAQLLNKEQVAAALVNVHSIKQLSIKNLQLFKAQLNDLVTLFDVKDKNSDLFYSKVNDFNLYLSLYKASMRLYAYATMVEVMLSGNYTEKYLTNCVSDIDSIVNEYSDEWDEINKKAYMFFNTSAALEPSLLQKIKLFFTGKRQEFDADVANTREDICEHYHDNFCSKALTNDIKPFTTCIKNLNVMYNKELDLYYYEGNLYIKNDSLQMEVI